MPSADSVTIRPIAPTDAAAFRALRLEALRTCPLAFTADVGETEAQPPEFWDKRAADSTGEGSQLIMLAVAGGQASGAPGAATGGPSAGADDGDKYGQMLVGMTGVYTQSAPKIAHIGHVWGVFVRDSHRGRGVGEALMRAAVAWARGKGLLVMKLGVAVGNDPAIRCYERCGFEIYATDPSAILLDGKLYDEHLMSLRL